MVGEKTGNTVIDPKIIYEQIKKKIDHIDVDFKLNENINQNILDNIKKSKDSLIILKNDLQSEITKLEDNSEWDNYTISFIGETNAGKSTIIEAVRIHYKEEVKAKETIATRESIFDVNYYSEILRQEEIKFNEEKTNIHLFKIKELEIFKEKAENKKKSMFFKFTFFFNKKHSPFMQEILNISNEIETNKKKKFENLSYVLLVRTKIKLAEERIIGDGKIIGDGRPDFTQENKEFFINIGNEIIKIIDVPGIEGDESKYEEEIKRAVSKSHCVYYITSTAKPFEPPTLAKIKKYINNQADVYAIVNVRHNRFQQHYINLGYKEIFENAILPSEDIRKQLRAELEKNFINLHIINGHWSFLGLAENLKNEKFINYKNKLADIFKSNKTILEKSNFRIIENTIADSAGNKTIKIRKTNILKVNTQIDSVIRKLNYIREETFSIKVVNDFLEQGEISKKEIDKLLSGFSKSLDNLRMKLVNNFKNNINAEVNEFINKNEIKKELYEENIRLICNNNIGNLDSDMKNEIKIMAERFDEQLKRTVEKFLDKINTISKINFTKLDNSNLEIEYDFLFSDLKNVGGILVNIGSLAVTGFMLGSSVPIVGSLIGAVIGGLLGAISEAFKFFQSTSSKKSKILLDIKNKLEIESQKLDQSIQHSFEKIYTQQENTLEGSLKIVDDVVEMYKNRRNVMIKITQELEIIKIKSNGSN